jgi:hypothetical protein
MKSLNRKRFTQQGVERLRYDKAVAPAGGRIEIEDGACPGLLLRVTPRNVKSFSVIYRVLGEGGTSPKGRLLCQSAFKFDPSSASNFDPFERRGLAVALVSSELAGVAETWRARVA